MSAPPPPASSAFSLPTLRLPKTLEADGTGAPLLAALRQNVRKLWSGGAIEVPVSAWSQGLASALTLAEREGHLVQGLEQAEKTLVQHARGVALADARSGAERGARVSRLLVVGNDGTERFYRQAERLVTLHAPRVLPLWIDAGSEQLASVLPRAGGIVRALLIEHKDSVARVLRALYPGAADGGEREPRP
ncbi:MAG TPA: hypothetical protein VMG12_14840 [Polyangiaceae bacterium]|nr:hypothetical protein [Polyangiaceae bacterium]